MAWLLFLDESGHDHRQMPYEIHGGIAIHASKLWPFIQAVQTLEQSLFGTHLRDHGTEIKGSKLLAKDRFKWSQQGSPLEEAARRKHALNFLQSSRQRRAPRREQFTAYGQACLAFAEGVIQILRSHDARLFAAAVPKGKIPPAAPAEFLRKDLVFLFERYFYFLEERQEAGLLILDGTDKAADRRLIRRMENYFTLSMNGRERTQWIVPVPMFVESDMAYGVQVADVCIYILNWGWRLAAMTEPTRTEIEPFARRLRALVWSGERQRDGQSFSTHSTFFVPGLYPAR